MQRAKDRLKVFVPLTIFIIFILYFFTFNSIVKTLIVMMSVPFALVGGIWYLFMLHYNMSIAVWVGLIALAGVAAETGSIMIVYLDEAYERRKKEGNMNNMSDLYQAVMEGAVQRLWAYARYVEYRYGSRCNEKDSRASDRRIDLIHNSDINRSSRDLYNVEEQYGNKTFKPINKTSGQWGLHFNKQK
jgi:hypothetical protein